MGRFSDIIDEIGSEATSDGFKQNLSAVEDIQPDREAETVKLANDFKTTPEFVRSNFDSFKKKHLEAQTNVDAFTATAPKSAEWAAKDPSNTALVKDNLPALKSIESSVNKHGVLKNSYKAINSGLWNTLGGFVGFQELSIDTLNTYIYNPILKKFGYAPAKTGAETIKGTALEDFRKFAKGAAESERSELPAAVSKDLAEQFKKGDVSGVGSNLYYNALLSSSNTAIGALAAYISGGAAGGLLASGSAMLASSSGQKYEELQGQVADEAQAGSEVAAPKITREQAIGSALTTGSIDALTESMFGSFQGIKRAISPVAASLTKSVGVNGTKEILKQFSFNVGKQALEEGPIEEGTASLLTNLSDYIYGVSDDLSTKKLIKDWVTSSAYGAVAGGMMTGPAATMVAMQQRAQAKQAQLNKETLLALGPEFTNSKLKERLPEKHREYVAEVTKGKPIENIYVPKEKFDAFFQDQGGIPAEAAGLIGIEKSYDESNTTGIVKIPLADWATRVVGTPTEQGLINDTKFSPEEMTVNESVEAKGQAQELFDEVSKKEEADKAIKTATREIEKDIAGKLEPVYGKATSSDMAKTWAKSYAVRARDVYAGENPLEVYKREGLKILGMNALPEGVQAFEQAIRKKNIAAKDPILLEKSKKLQEEGFSFWESPDMVFDENGEEISGPKKGKEGYAFTVFVQDKTGNDIGQASFIIKDGELVPNDFDGDREAVNVDPSFRRKGIATELYRLASAHVNKPVSNKNWQTPEGKALRSKLRDINPEIFLQQAPLKTDTPEFKAWFGDSKAVDESGKPKVFYHGTMAPDIESFELSNYSGIAGFFSPNKEFAKKFAEDEYYAASGKSLSGGETPTVYEVYLKAENTFDYSNNEHIEKVLGKLPLKKLKEITGNTQTKINGRAINKSEILQQIQMGNYNFIEQYQFVDAMRAAGFDSAYIYEEGNKNIAVFDNTQIKSVNNRGTFDTSSNIYTQADKQKTVRGFFDPVARLMGLIKGEANVSTALHEMGHVWLEQAKLDYNYLKSQETLNEDQQAYVKRADDLLKFLEVNSFEDIKREQHEKFAAAAESYFLRGVAPSKSLEQIFSRLKTWMVEIYRDLKGLVAQRGEGANLNPEVVDFFDRLLATEDELMEAQSNYPELFGDNIPEDVANKWYKASSDAAEAGTALILKPVMADFERKKQKLYRDEKKQVKENLFNAIKERAEQKALDALNDPQVKDLPDEIKAEMFGFKNTQDFNTALEKARADRGPNLDAQVEAEMKIRYPDSLDKLEEKAIEAVNNDKLKDKLLLEKDYIKTKFSSPEVAARLIRDLPNIKAIKNEAEVRILNKTVREINPRTYDLASRKAARDAARSYKEFERAKGVNEKDEALRKAFDFKKQQVLNHEMFKAAIKARTEVEAKRKDYKKFFKSNADLSDRRNIDYINTGRAILAEYGLGRSDKTADEYLQSTKKYDKDTYESLIALVKDATRGANNYKEVSFGKFSQMTKAVDALWSISRSSEVQTVEGQKVEREKAIAEMKAKTDTHLKDKGFKKGYESAGNKHGGFKTAYMKLKSALVRVEAWVDVMDLGDINGPFRKYIFEPMNAAVIKYLNKKNATLETFAKMLTEHGKTIKDPKMLITADELQTWDAQDEQYKPFQFTKMQLLMAVLHTGNKSNKSKLLRGYGWGVETDGILDTSKWDSFINRMIDNNILTKEDFEFAQSVWDLMDSFKAETQKAHYEIEGYYFEEISSESFTNKHGAYRGGYVPAKLDAYAEPDAAKREEIEIFEKNNPSMAFPTTGKGATMSRNESFARRLSLDLNLLGSHMDWALRYSFLEPRAREVSRLINDRSMKDLLQTVDPTIYSALTAWLQRTAQQRIEVPSTNLLIKAIDPMARYIRTSAAMQVMFGNLTNALQQSTGLVVAMAKVHPRYIASGVLDYLSGFDGKKNKLVEDIVSKSEFMNNLQGQNIYELQNAVQEVLVNPNVFQKTQEFSMKHAYILQTMAQNFVNVAVWQGAYNEAVKNKMSEKDAIKQADSVVRLTQGTNRTVDVAAYEQNSPTARLFIQFAGYFNMLLNLNAGEAAKIIKTVGARKGGGKLFYLYMTGFMLPAVIAGSIVKLMKGTGFDEDDDGEYTDDLLALFAGEQFKTATAMVPALGSLATATYNKAFTDQMYDDRLNMSLALSSLEQTLGFPFELYKDIKDETIEAGKLTKDAMTFMGIITATPLTQAGKSMKYLIDVNEGNVAPSGVLDFTRGVVTGKSGEQ